MTAGELIQLLYKVNPNLPVVLPGQEFYAGSEHTGTITVEIEQTIDDVLDFDTKVVLTLKKMDETGPCAIHDKSNKQ